MGVEDGGVDHQGVHQPQGPEVVLQAVPYEYCAAGDEPHQVVLDVAEALDGAGLQVALGQPREAGVVVHDRVLRKHQRVVDGATVDPNLKKIISSIANFSIFLKKIKNQLSHFFQKIVKSALF